MKRIIGGKLDIPLSPGVQVGDTLFLSGQVPTREDGSMPEGVAAQTELVLKKLAALAEEAGFTMTDIVKTTVFLADMNDFSAMNGAYGKFFPNEPPARSCINARAPIPCAVEIEAIAVRSR